MATINEKQLIESLSELKNIKPRKEWAVLLKSQILAEQKPVQAFVNPMGFRAVFSSVLFQRKLGYSFAAIAFIFIGLVGFAKYTVPGDLLFPIKKMTEQSQVAIMGQTSVRQDVAILNNRISDLAQLSKEGRKSNIPSAVNEVNANVSQLTKNLKSNPVKDPETIKEIASTLKTLADVQGTDAGVNQDVQDLYQTVVQNQIIDLEKTTLTDDQAKTLTEVKDMYEKGKYADALEKVLMIGGDNKSKSKIEEVK